MMALLPQPSALQTCSLTGPFCEIYENFFYCGLRCSSKAILVMTASPWCQRQKKIVHQLDHKIYTSETRKGHQF